MITVFKDNIRIVAAVPSLLQSVTFQAKLYFIDRLEADSKKLLLVDKGAKAEPDSSRVENQGMIKLFFQTIGSALAELIGHIIFKSRMTRKLSGREVPRKVL